MAESESEPGSESESEPGAVQGAAPEPGPIEPSSAPEAGPVAAAVAAEAPKVPEAGSVAVATEPPVGWALPDAAPQFAKVPVQAGQASAPAPLASVPAQAGQAPPPAPHAPFGQAPAQPGLVPPPFAPFGQAPAQAGLIPPPFAYQQPAPPAAPRKRPSKRILPIVAGVVTALALVAAGVVALLPGRSGNSVVAAVHCQPSDLTTCLIKAPAGADRLSGAATWDQEIAVTADLYSANIVKGTAGLASDTATLLDADGLHSIVHTDWNAVDGDNVDLVVLQFGSQKGARAWNSVRSGEILAAYRGSAVSIPGDTAAEAHAATKADSQGNVGAAYSTVVGDLVLDVAYSSPNSFSAQDLKTWAGTELTSLRNAPAAAADPADAGSGTEKVACGGGLGSCLTPMPSDGERWSSPTSKNWISASTLTPKQYVTLFWDGKPDAQPQVLSNMSQDGVTGIAHRDWATNSAYKQADLYLIQTITAAGAEQLTSTNYGEPDWGSGVHGKSYTIPGESEAQAWYTTSQDSNGFVDFYFVQNIGNVVAEGWMFFYGSFDSGTANSWAKSELDRVSGTASTQPMGLFPLSAPALPAAAQGACPSSGDCLLPLPAGATDTTASSYQVGKDLNSGVYAAQYESDSSTDVGSWLDADGYATAEHRSWTASDGATADAVLVKYGTPAQAQAAALLENGLNTAKDRVCTDSAVPDSLCLAAPVAASDYLQKETIRVLAWKGDYEVSISVTRSNAADLAQAYTWAQQQLDLLPAS